MRALLVLWLIGCGGAPAAATATTAATAAATAGGGAGDTVDAIVAKVMAEAHVPGMAVAVVKDGAVRKARGYGTANLEWPSPVTAQTRFQIASSTKVLTGTLVRMLVEDGTLDLDRPVAAYLPDAPPAWGAMTLRQLAAHAGEVAAFLESRAISVRDAYAAVKALPLGFAPGSKVKYGTGDFIVLVHAIETATKRSFEQLLEARIFQPLGFTCTLFEHETEAGQVRMSDVVGQRAGVYRRAGTAELSARFLYPAYTYPSGGAVMCLDDLVKWSIAMDRHASLRAIAEQMQRGAASDEALFARPAELIPTLREWGPIQFAALPALDDFALVTAEPTRRRYRASYGRVTGAWTFVLDADHKVVDLDFAIE